MAFLLLLMRSCRSAVLCYYSEDPRPFPLREIVYLWRFISWMLMYCEAYVCVFITWNKVFTPSLSHMSMFSCNFIIAIQVIVPVSLSLFWLRQREIKDPVLFSECFAWRVILFNCHELGFVLLLFIASWCIQWSLYSSPFGISLLQYKCITLTNLFWIAGDYRENGGTGKAGVKFVFILSRQDFWIFVPADHTS